MLMTAIRKIILFTIMLALICTTACTTNKKQGNNKPFVINDVAPPGMLSGSNKAVIPLVTENGEKYISISALVNTLEYHGEWDPLSKTYSIGDTDAVYQIRVNSKVAWKEDTPVNLSSSPIMIGGLAYLPVSGISQLFQGDMDYQINDQSLILTALQDTNNVSDQQFANKAYDFAEEPQDPTNTSVSSSNVSAARLKKINMNKLISTSKNYLGVKYKFGAAPYPRSKRFDCSTFSRFVFSKYGIGLSRTARSQSKQGTAVSRKKLRKGDLLFFYVPGRFKSNRIVGHIGIYMGNGRMINASPEPKNGVQIININSTYWKKTFLKARRVAY